MASSKLFLFLGVLLFARIVTSANHPIPDAEGLRLNSCDPSTFTISGISSGACMAVQFQYAWSSIVKGAGIVASAPFLCAAGSLTGAMRCINYPDTENVIFLVAATESYAETGVIDPLSNIANQTLYLFSGTEDTVVPQRNMVNVRTMLETFNNTHTVSFFNYSAEHAWITSKYGNACSALSSPYINNCNLDFAGRFLGGTFLNLGHSWNNTMGTVNSSNLFTVNQTSAGADPATNSVAAVGYAYIPRQCQRQQGGNQPKCHLHMNLHGCNQGAYALGTEYVLSTEINEWAESNNIIVLYPQATSNALLGNPDGCWDWWGYAGSNYAQKSGAQVSVLRKMVTALGGF